MKDMPANKLMVKLDLPVTLSMVLYNIEHIKEFDIMNNKSRFEDILQSMSDVGILGFIINGLFVTPFNNYIRMNDGVRYVIEIIIVLLLIIPILCAILIIRQENWKYRE